MNEILRDNLDMLKQSVSWLAKSYERCQGYSLDSLDEQALVELEAFTSRFGRVVDILIQKVFRSIDHAELETQGTLVDVVNRACKRGIIDNVDTVRQLKDVRNSIAHEYREQDLMGLFALTLKLTPLLLSYAENAQQYVESNFS